MMGMALHPMPCQWCTYPGIAHLPRVDSVMGPEDVASDLRELTFGRRQW